MQIFEWVAAGPSETERREEANVSALKPAGRGPQARRVMRAPAQSPHSRTDFPADQSEVLFREVSRVCELAAAEADLECVIEAQQIPHRRGAVA